MSMEGKQVPNCVFKSKKRSISLLDISTDKIFKGKKVVFFALPGAFTPTCTMEQLPRYEQLAKLFIENGIDEVVCLGVNDPFIMEKWGEDMHINEVRILADGNAEFTKAMGMDIDLSGAGLGTRSKRYSMYVEDGVIKKMFIEDEGNPTGMSVSDADTMFKYLFPNKPAVPNIALIVQPGCPDCAKMKLMLEEAKLPYEQLRYGYEVLGSMMKAITGESTFPQVFIDGKHIPSEIFMDGKSLKNSSNLLSKILDHAK